jgi:hypothetical protein
LRDTLCTKGAKEPVAEMMLMRAANLQNQPLKIR